MTRTNKLPDELPAADMARLLSITPRRLQALAARGTLPKDGRNTYPVAATLRSYVEHVVGAERLRAGSPSADRLRDQRREEIRRRMQRDDRELVQIDEAIETLAETTGQLLGVVDGLPALITRNRQDRRNIAPVVGSERDRLAAGFRRIAEKLRTGADEPEDDE